MTKINNVFFICNSKKVLTFELYTDTIQIEIEKRKCIEDNWCLRAAASGHHAICEHFRLFDIYMIFLAEKPEYK